MHKLRDLNKEELTAHCEICGPVEVLVKYRKARNSYEWRCANKEREGRRTRVKRYQKANPEKVARYSRTYDARKRGVIVDCYDKEVDRLLIEQSGLCAICSDQLIRLHLDHCHKTGQIRGLLCPGCNHGIGFLKDDIVVMQNAINYLTK